MFKVNNPHFKRPQLLLIDDEMSSVALLMTFLKAQDMELLVALGGRDGIAKAFKCQPDLILLDVRIESPRNL